MDDADEWWTGSGATPREAVEDLVPTTDRDDVARVEGLLALSDRADPDDHDETRYRELTIIYESKPVKQWKVGITPEETEWQASFIGAKKIGVG